VKPPPARGNRASGWKQRGPWWASLLNALRGVSWTLKLVVVGAAIMIGYPLFDAIDSTIPHPIHKRGGLWVCDLKTLSNFDLDQVHGRTEDIPKELRELDGKRVAMVGQMWAPYGANGRVHNFDLVYSVTGCCFSGPPKVQHVVKARVNDGQSVGYCRGRVDVTGTLHVGVQKDGDAIDSIYRVDVDSVKPD
jgi:hypothetical protein